MSNLNYKVFLGGTCNESTWREELKPMLSIEFFDPVVPDWNEAAATEEIKQRKECDFVLYVITPRMTGVYSIAEVVDDSNKRPNDTIFCLLENDKDEGTPITFSPAAMKSLHAVKSMVAKNGGTVLDSLQAVATYLNNKK